MKLARITLVTTAFIATAWLTSACDLNQLDPVDGGASNSAPTINTLTAEPPSIEAGGVALVSCGATDPEGDVLTFEWDIQEGTLEGEGPTVTWFAPTTQNAYRISVTVSDPSGRSADDQLFLPVTAAKVNEPGNNHPIIESFTSSASTLDTGETATLTVVASDPDGDALSYEWLMGIGQGDAEGPETDWTPIEGICCTETYVVVIKVRDGHGGLATGTVEIFVIVG